MSMNNKNIVTTYIRIFLFNYWRRKKLFIFLFIFFNIFNDFIYCCIVTDMDCEKNLDDYVREADEVMYEEKTAKKANRK